MSIAIWCLLTKHWGPCQQLAIFSDACQIANYKQTQYTFFNNDTGVWHRGFSSVRAYSLPLDGALVGFSKADAAAHKKGCQELDKDDVSFLPWSKCIVISGASPRMCSWPWRFQRVKQPVTNKSQSWESSASSQALPNNYAVKCSNCTLILMLIPISIISLDLYGAV